MVTIYQKAKEHDTRELEREIAAIAGIDLACNDIKGLFDRISYKLYEIPIQHYVYDVQASGASQARAHRPGPLPARAGQGLRGPGVRTLGFEP